MDATQEIQVVNHNDFALQGRFDGQHYSFPPGKATKAPYAAVCHIFGYGLDRNDRKAIAGVLNRLGVLRLGGDYNAALAVRMKVEFRTGTVVFAETPEKSPGKNEEPDEDEEKPPEKPDEGIGAARMNPGAPRSAEHPGGKSEAAGPSMTTASADLPRRRGRPPKLRPEEY
jgi:hypothetical protein